jgi:sec-independent protein translocase protein TatA
MFANLTGWHVVIILAVVLLLFGATRLPALAKAVGQSAKVFRSEMNTPETPKLDTVDVEVGHINESSQKL